MSNDTPSSARAEEDVRIRKATLSILGLAAFGMLCVAGAAFLLHHWQVPQPSTAPHPQRLEADDINQTERAATLRAQQRARLQAWDFDPETGVARIPVRAAMRLALDAGLDAGLREEPDARAPQGGGP
ncbi:MAG: hypothetical protein KC766_26035 [Myxococcales bacterium]|nr:hypothetical protein [Myxococcales bacterium]